MKKKRVGVYGGTFSPPHIAHVRVAKAFSDALSLDKLLIIPAFLPPHKQVDKNISANTRLEMCRLAFSDIENAEVSDIEIARGGKSYTAITLESLSSDDVELFLLCGTDMFLTLDSWYSPKKIFERAAHEITFSDISDSPIETIGTCDEYMTDYFGFNVDGQRIYIKNELLGVAVSLLSEQKRNIILMSYFLDMTDSKIANKLNFNHSNITYHRHSALKILKRYMEDMKYDKIQRN